MASLKNSRGKTFRTCARTPDPSGRPGTRTEHVGRVRTVDLKIWSGTGLRAAQNVFTFRGSTICPSIGSVKTLRLKYGCLRKTRRIVLFRPRDIPHRDRSLPYRP